MARRPSTASRPTPSLLLSTPLASHQESLVQGNPELRPHQHVADLPMINALTNLAANDLANNIPSSLGALRPHDPDVAIATAWITIRTIVLYWHSISLVTSADSLAISCQLVVPTSSVPSFGTLMRDPEVTPQLPVSFVHANGTFSFECYPDSGSATSLISTNLVSLHRLPVQPQSLWTVFISVNGVHLSIHGKVLLDVNGNIHHLHLLISPDITKEVLLGYKILHELGVVPKDFPQFPVSTIKDDVVSNTCASSSLKTRLLSKFPEVLTSVLPQKPMETECMEIFLNDCVDVKPTHVINARPVPQHYQDKANVLVWKLVNESIITKVDVPTTWCSPTFFVKKPGGSLWLVIDYTGLNKCVRHAAHQFPATQDVVAGLDPLATIYAKVDALRSYFQVPLSKEASYLTTFLLPSGMY